MIDVIVPVSLRFTESVASNLADCQLNSAASDCDSNNSQVIITERCHIICMRPALTHSDTLQVGDDY